MYFIWTLVLTAELPVLPDLGTLILTTDILSGTHGGFDRSAEDAYSSWAPDPSLTFVGGLCCPTLDFVIAFWTMVTFYTLLTSLFCISLDLHVYTHSSVKLSAMQRLYTKE
jgi:hypothetical protein